MELRRYEACLWLSGIVNAIVMGSAFWLVAANGDLTVRLVMTLLSCFYAIGALVNASSHFPSFATVTVIHLGQGSCSGWASAQQTPWYWSWPFRMLP